METWWNDGADTALFRWLTTTAVRDPGRAAPFLRALLRMPLSNDVRDSIETLMIHFWDPDRLLPPLVRYLEVCIQAHVVPQPEVLRELAPVLAYSGVLGRMLFRYPNWGLRVVADGFLDRPKEATAWKAEVWQTFSEIDDAERLDEQLRCFRNKEMLRIAVRELRGEDVRETAFELSILAEICLEVAVRFWRRELTKVLGVPRLANGNVCRFVIMGMGKLGGHELNYSSDIDLIYFYEADDEQMVALDVNADTAGDGPKKAADLHRWFSKLSEYITRSVSRVTDDGFCFRVDLGLRPEGKFGPICNSVAAAEAYYESWGHPWERVAWVRARPVAGDLDLGTEILRTMTPFMWRKTLDMNAIDDIRRMKAQIDEKARKLTDESGVSKSWDVKLGQGGIREIEFFVNAFQLVYGGKMPVLRDASTVRAMKKLVYAGLVPVDTGEHLRDAYLLFRRVEHRIQIAEERQTHTLPADRQALDALARSMGMTGTETEVSRGLMELLEKPRRVVAGSFDRLLHAESKLDNKSSEIDNEADADAHIALSTDVSDRQRTKAMVALGYDIPRKGNDDGHYEPLEVIKSMQRRPTTPFHPRHAGRFGALCHNLVREVGSSAQPGVAIRHLRDFVWNLRENTALYEILQVAESARRLLVTLFASSAYLARAVARRPYLVDSLVFQGQGTKTKSKQAMRTELAGILAQSDDLETTLNLCRRFQTDETVRVALLDLAGELSVDEVGSQLSDLADVLIAAVLDHTVLDLKNQGKMTGPPLAIVALGRLGTREMGFVSDLDLLFLYADADIHKDAVERQQTMVRLAHRFITNVTCMLAEGTLYSVDTRLRPDGGHGALVVSVDTFLRYHRDSNRSDWWEKQALLKARFVAGDETCAVGLESCVASVVFQPMPPEDLAAQMHRLRQRLLDEVARENSVVYNIKFGRGGILEVEFIVQLHQLRLGYGHPDLRFGTVPELVRRLVTLGVVHQHEGRSLVDAWRFFRRLENRIRLLRDRSVDELHTRAPEVDRLARQMGYGQVPGRTASEQLLVHYKRHADAVFALYCAHFIQRGCENVFTGSERNDESKG